MIAMQVLSKEETAARIAKNVAAMIDRQAEKTFVLNLGVGIPTQGATYVTNENVYIHAENGMVGVGPLATPEQVHPMLINAGRQPVTETPGCAYLDSSLSFGMIRGGYVDATVLGAFEVDQDANVSNWIVPNGKQLGVGGAMDLVAGAKQVIIAMTHTSKGKAKLIPHCTLPITSPGAVKYVVTEYGIFDFCGGKVTLTAMAPDITLDELKSITALEYEVAENLQTMVV